MPFSARRLSVRFTQRLIHRVEHDVVLKLAEFILHPALDFFVDGFRRPSCADMPRGIWYGREVSISRSPEVNQRGSPSYQPGHRLWNSISAAGWLSEPRSNHPPAADSSSAQAASRRVHRNQSARSAATSGRWRISTSTSFANFLRGFFPFSCIEGSSVLCLSAFHRSRDISLIALWIRSWIFFLCFGVEPSGFGFELLLSDSPLANAGGLFTGSPFYG